jgi:hypothetical protein
MQIKCSSFMHHSFTQLIRVNFQVKLPHIYLFVIDEYCGVRLVKMAKESFGKRLSKPLWLAQFNSSTYIQYF